MDLHRRTYLGAVAGMGLAALSGCASTAEATKRPPEVPEERLRDGGWQLLEESTEDPAYEKQFGPATLTATTTTRLYEDAAFRAEIEEKTLGAASGQLATFFASRVTFDPNLASMPVGRDRILDEVEREARRNFESQLRNAGLSDVTRADTGTFDVESGAEARLTSYDAAYSFDGLSVRLAPEESLDIAGGDIAIAGHLAAWTGDEAVLLAGGAYPAENFRREVSKSPSSAIDVDVTVDLELTPDAYREELFGLMRRVE